MARPPRTDHPGAWWHLYNRGIAKRTVFEAERDVERFLRVVGEAVARGWLEVHAYSVLTTHFHLLARSPCGEISRALHRIGQFYVRWFNRSRLRDGPLFRGRCGGRRIDDPVYWGTVLRYIDCNAPRARMCRAPSDHPYGSARAYRFGGGPEWLRRDHVEAEAAAAEPGGAFVPAHYDAFTTAGDADRDAHLVETLMGRPAVQVPRFADLVRAASLRQQSWMQWKTALADGSRPGAAFLGRRDALRAADIAARALRRRPLPNFREHLERDLRIALLHHAGGLCVADAAAAEGVGRPAAYRALERHRLQLAGNPRYEAIVCRVLRAAVLVALHPARHPLAIPACVQTGGLRPVLVQAR